MDWSILGWVCSAALIIIGLAGTVLPALPGVPLVFAGLLLGAWLEGFNHIGAWTLALLAGLGASALLIDFIAGALGAKRLGASPRAFWGASAGALVGLFFGLPGLLLGPFIGAVLAEIGAGRNWRQAGKAGVGTWLGMIVGTAAKLGIVFLMLGVFIFQRFV